MGAASKNGMALPLTVNADIQSYPHFGARLIWKNRPCQENMSIGVAQKRSYASRRKKILIEKYPKTVIV
jgi:hypothetical protein